MEVVSLLDSPSSSRAYEADISLSESYGSVALSEALPTEADSVQSPTPGPVHHVRCRPLSSVRQQVELIRAQSRIVELESALAGVRQAQKRARIEGDGHMTSRVTLGKEELDRLHKLEQERCQLLEELNLKKSQLETTETRVKELTAEMSQVSESSEQEIKRLKVKVAELSGRLMENECEKERLTGELDRLRLDHSSHTLQQLDTLRLTHTRALESLTSRVGETEGLEAQLKESRGRVRELERELKTLRQDSYFVDTVRDKLLKYDHLERRCGQLVEENAVLTQARDNQHLLRYKVSALQERCERVQKLEEDVARLSLQNSELKARLEEGGDGTDKASGGVAQMALLQYRISQLQNNEKLLVHKRGLLETRVNVAETEAQVAKRELAEVKGLLTKEQQESRAKDERIQKLEKRLLFVAKEREGCMNVLNSYSRDSGVDELLRQSVSELRSQLERANGRIAELEAVLEQQSADTPQ